ncbi:NAD(P)/FAD-dependent oxidoreductase [Halostagnicola kamekurae]|uniref:Phytoene dehydrogenase-related protein n=1 Tax=Halostagnicola kamekurae TaxID=619731 RepID=A0A1I6P022_9EURY|nr:NAD(P)/FAD-dependent oxidoreductase [Halostagnicola kamekurae]SFS33420.1 Phytoene dehydrogenase-related protein [Halostagnicola kamekurae]
MSSSPRVIVVGAGLAGLVASRHLAAAGADVTCLERRETVGGRVRTATRDGFRLDRGFQVLFTGYPAVRRELDLEALELRRFAPGAVLAGPDGRSTLGDPVRDPTALLATLRNGDVTLGDKLRVLRLRAALARRPLEFEAVFAGGEDDESIAEFLRERGFSERFLENFAGPFYRGITLDRSLSTSKRVFEYTFAALAAGHIAVPADGMGAITAQLASNARRAGAAVETETAVTAIGEKRSGASDSDEGTNERGRSVAVEVANGGDRTADAVVLATDPKAARELTGLESIPTDARSCVTQYYRLPADTGLETESRLLLNTGERGPNHVVPHSDVAPEYAPEGATLVSATFLGDREEDDGELTELTGECLESWYRTQRFDRLEPIHTDRVQFAQFAQPPGIHETLPDVRDAGDGVYLAGEYTRWSSIQGAMASGRAAAEAVVDDYSRGTGR